MKPLLLLSFLLSIIHPALHSQNIIQWAWQKDFNVQFNDIEYSNNAIYAAGDFTTASVTLGSATYNNAGGKDVILCKMDTLGNVIWSKHYGSSSNESINNICVDPNGDVVAIGEMNNTLVVGTNTLVSNGGNDVLILKCDNAGNLQFGKNIGNTSNNYPVDITLDYDHAIYACFSNSGVLNFASINSPASTFTCFAKLSSSGTELDLFWLNGSNQAGYIPATGGVDAMHYSTVDSSIVFGGYINAIGNTTKLEFTSLSNFNCVSIGYSGSDIFIGKFKTNGSPVFINRNSMTHSRSYRIVDLKVHSDGRIIYNVREQFSLNGFTYNNWVVCNMHGSEISNQGFSLSSNSAFLGSCYENGYQVGKPGKMQIVDSILYATLYQPVLLCGNINCSDYYAMQYNLNTAQLTYANTDPSTGYLCGAGHASTFYLAGKGGIAKSCVANCIQQALSVHPAPDAQVCMNYGTQIGSSPCYYAFGGSPPYTYSWQPSIGLNNPLLGNPLVTGLTSTTTYTVTITDQANNVVYDTVTVQVNPIPVITSSVSANPFCIGNSVSLTLSGGVNYYLDGSNIPQNNPIILAPTQDTIISIVGISSAGCSGYTSKLLESFKISAHSTTPLICPNSVATLHAAGAANYTWVPGNVNGSTYNPVVGSSTIYTVTGVSSSGCAATATVSQLVSSEVTITANPTAVCVPDTIQLNANGTGYLNGPQTLPSGYCIPSTTINNSVLTTINSFRFHDLVNNSSGVQTTAFGDFTNIPPTTVVKGQTYPFSITRMNNVGLRYKIWIDWNRNGSFLDPDEEVINSVSATSNKLTTDSTIMINTAALEGVTRMRVSCIHQNSTINTPCMNFTNYSGFGECEDYAINIVSNQGLSNFSWNPATTPSSGNSVQDAVFNPGSTSYTATISDFIGCPQSASIQVNAYLSPQPIIYSTPPTLTCGNTSGIVSYQWSYNNAPIGTNDSVLAFNQVGLYQISCIDSNGCVGTDNFALALKGSSWTIYPNPTAGVVWILCEERDTPYQVEFYNEFGQLLKTFEISTVSTPLDLLPYASGIYFLRIDGQVKKIIKQR